MKNGPYCYVPTTHRATLGEIVDLLDKFAAQPKTLPKSTTAATVTARF